MQKYTCMAVLVMMVALVMLPGCGGLPEETRNRATKQVPQRIESAVRDVQNNLSGYEQIKASDVFTSFLNPYAQRENWSEHITTANEKIAHAKKLNEELQTLVAENNEEDLNKVNTLIQRIYAAIGEAKSASEAPAARAVFLQKVRENAPAMVQKAEEQQAQMRVRFEKLSTFMNEITQEFPDREEDISKIFAVPRKHFNDAQKDLETAKQQFNAQTPDYAALGDSVRSVASNQDQLAASDKQVREKLGELRRSYSKTLVDMKVDYYVTIGRASWDMDGYGETTHTYQRKVSDSTFE